MKTLSVRIDDLRSMLTAMEADKDLAWCESCGAWIEYDSEVLATTECFTGCWKMATDDDRWSHLCVSWRGALIDELKLAEEEER